MAEFSHYPLVDVVIRGCGLAYDAIVACVVRCSFGTLPGRIGHQAFAWAMSAIAVMIFFILGLANSIRGTFAYHGLEVVR